MKKILLPLLLSIMLTGCEAIETPTDYVGYKENNSSASEEIELLQPEIIKEEIIEDNTSEENTETPTEEVPTEETTGEVPTEETAENPIEEVPETTEPTGFSILDTVPETEEVNESVAMTAKEVLNKAINVTPNNYIFTSYASGTSQGTKVSGAIKMEYDDMIVHDSTTFDMGMGMVMSFESWYDYNNDIGYSNGLGSWMPATCGEYTNAPKLLCEAALESEVTLTEDSTTYIIECDLPELNFGDSLTQAECSATLTFDKETGYLTRAEYKLDEAALQEAGMSEYETYCTFTDYNNVSLTIPEEVKNM